MKQFVAAVAIVALGSVFTGCSYGPIVASGEKIIIAKNDLFLGGLLRVIYVCKVTDSGVTACKTAENP